MYRITAVVLAFAACTHFVPSQATTFTSPKGLSSTEGNTLFYASTNRVYQGIDATHKGTVWVMKEFAMRRDKVTASTAGASTVDATLTIGETNMTIVHSDPTRNFSVKKTLVFPKKNINWPDWSLASPTPAPFDFKIPFSTSYIYLGLNALVWDLTLENGTNTGNKFDRHFTFYKTGTTALLSAGCASFAHTAVLESNGPALANYGMRLKAGIKGGPPAAPVSISLAVADANATVPGWCAKLHAIPLAILPIGVANSTGQVFNCYWNFPFDVSMNGFSLITQAFSVSGGGLVLSGGRTSIMATNAATTGDEAGYVWHTLGRDPNGFVFHGGSIVVQFGT
jgi:hypothetical protein